MPREYLIRKKRATKKAAARARREQATARIKTVEDRRVDPVLDPVFTELARFGESSIAFSRAMKRVAAQKIMVGA